MSTAGEIFVPEEEEEGEYHRGVVLYFYRWLGVYCVGLLVYQYAWAGLLMHT